MKTVYFDHNSATPIRKEVLESIIELVEKPLNPAATHALGKEAKAIVDKARLSILKSVNADKDKHQVIFTSSATEANNLVLKGLQGFKIITTVIEHPSVFNVVGEGQISVDENGVIKLDELEEVCKALNGQKFLVSIMAANNETGAIQQIKQASEIVHKYGGLIHSDAVQALGKMPLDMTNLGLDMLTISSHKIGGDFGAAALIIPKNMQLVPLFQGGGQEGGMRSGTHNTRAIHGFAIACELAVSDVENYKNHVEPIRDYIEQEIVKFSPEVVVFSGKAERLPNTLSITMPNVKSETQLIHFDINGFEVSAGAACSSSRLAIPRVQMCMGYSEDVARTTLRVSIGMSNTMEEAREFVECWKQLYLQVNNVKKVA